jgi:hypothetical protein
MNRFFEAIPSGYQMFKLFRTAPKKDKSDEIGILKVAKSGIEVFFDSMMEECFYQLVKSRGFVAV